MSEINWSLLEKTKWEMYEASFLEIAKRAGAKRVTRNSYAWVDKQGNFRVSEKPYRDAFPAEAFYVHGYFAGVRELNRKLKESAQ